MQEISPDDLCDKLKTGELNYINIYNNLEPQQHFSIKHYLQNEHDTIEKDQTLNILFLDIEVYANHSGDFKPTTANQPISAITIYSTFEKIYHVYFLILNVISSKITSDQIKESKETIRNELLNYEYLDQDNDIQIHTFYDELEMLNACWNKVHEIDPSILSSFYGDGFDIPYIYNRLKKLYNGDENKVSDVMSKFGIVKPRKTQRGMMYQIAEYPLLDIQHLYKPRDENGLNQGEKEPSYTLDWISEKHLNMKKLEYKDEGMSLDAFYEYDPVNYIKYNIIDVVLTVKLNEKLQHIELYNMIRRDMKTPISMSLRGPSALFDTLFNYEIDKIGSTTRHGVVNENIISIDENEAANIPLPKQSKIKKWTVNSVDSEFYSKMLKRYPGAYVKDSFQRIVNENDGIVIDLDASALYPLFQ